VIIWIVIVNPITKFALDLAPIALGLEAFLTVSFRIPESSWLFLFLSGIIRILLVFCMLACGYASSMCCVCTYTYIYAYLYKCILCIYKHVYIYRVMHICMHTYIRICMYMLFMCTGRSGVNHRHFSALVCNGVGSDGLAVFIHDVGFVSVLVLCAPLLARSWLV